MCALANPLLQCNKTGSAALGERSIIRHRPSRGFSANGCFMAKAKAAVVTGSTSGIGLAIARALARGGTNVMLNGFGDAGEIEKTRAEVERQCGVRALYSAADMSKPAEIAEMIRTAEQAFGGVDRSSRSRNGTRSSPSIFPRRSTASARRCRA